MVRWAASDHMPGRSHMTDGRISRRRFIKGTVVTSSSIIGCMGTLDSARALTLATEDDPSSAAFRVFVSGSKPHCPDAILSVARDAPVSLGDEWTEVKLATPQLHQLVKWMQPEDGEVDGGEVLDPGGKLIGFWCSSVRGTAVRVSTSGRISCCRDVS